MKLARSKNGNYELTTRVPLPSDIKRFYHVTETGYSPKLLFYGDIIYEVPDKEPGLHNLLDYILDRE